MTNSIAGVFRPLLLTVGPSDSLEAAAGLMVDHHVGALAVWDGELEGMLSERDLARAMAAGAAPARTRVVDYMTPRPYVVSPEDACEEVARLMVEEGIRHAPVVAANAVVGMISVRDLLAWSLGQTA